MKQLVILLSILALPLAARAAAYGSLNNFDVVNDTGHTNYGFCIELDDLHSTDISYTYDYNHYGVPKITEDKTDPLHPKVFVRYEPKRNADGSVAAGSWTNPQDSLHPLGPTGGHAFTDPSVNLGGEHFGVGYSRPPSLVKYNWLVQDSLNPGALVLSSVVNVATPTFTYVPAAAGVPAQAQVVVVPPPPEVPEVNSILQFGVPVWVKVLKTVQPSGKHVHLDELLPSDPAFPSATNWAGAEPPEVEVEWQVFQRRPTNNLAGPGEMMASDTLTNGDETVTRRYEFYAYNGPVNPDDGEAQCSDTNACPDAIGAFLGAQMAGFNVVTPLGLIAHLQDGDISTPYVDRTVVTGGTTPYAVAVTAGALPNGLSLDPTNGVLSGTPMAGGVYTFTIRAADTASVRVTNAYTLTVTPVPLVPDTNRPSIRITSPTASPGYHTTNAILAISGTATDNVAVVSVVWTNSAGGDGIAIGTTNWAASGITLHSGLNVLTVTARDAANNPGTDALSVIYLPPRADTRAPRIRIVSPTDGLRVSNAVFVATGTTEDDTGVATVFYQLNSGGWATASTSNNWVRWTANLTAMPGTNTLKAYAVDGAANHSPTNRVSFVYVLSDRLRVLINGSGKVSPNYSNALLELGKSFTMTAKAGNGYVFSNWTDTVGSVVTDHPVLRFTMESNLTFTANFILNPFFAPAGTYRGLFFDTNDITLGSSGYFGAQVTRKGAFTAKVQQGTKMFPFSGQFSADGTWMGASIRGLSNVTARLQLDLSGGDALTGLLSNASWTAELKADRAVYSRTNRAPEAGKYTLVIPGSTNALVEPGGNGAAALTVDGLGNVNIHGTLGDGTPVTESTIVSKRSQSPLYIPLYGNRGSMLGWLTFTNKSDRDIEGLLNWIKLEQPAATLYHDGFTNEIEAMGSKYSFVNGVRILNLTNGVVTLEGSTSIDGITNEFTLGANSKVTGSNKLHLTFVKPSGLFTGSTTNSDGKTVSFSGAVLQKQNNGYGWFRDNDETKGVFLQSR